MRGLSLLTHFIKHASIERNKFSPPQATFSTHKRPYPTISKSNLLFTVPRSPIAQLFLLTPRDLSPSHMQSEPIETLNRSESFTSSTTSFSSIQHGSSHYDIHDLHRAPSERSSSFLSESGRSESISSDDARLESRGGSLSWQFVNGVPFTPGQRISEYENAMIQQTPKRALGFKIVKSAHSDNSSGVNILDFPNGTQTP